MDKIELILDIELRYDKYSKKYENGFGARSMTRNMRTVWEENTSPSSDDHYAMYPEKLLVRMIEAGCPKEICNKCGTPRITITEMGKVVDSGGGSKRSSAGLNSKPNIDQKERIAKGMTDCGCNAGFSPGIILDPFAGSGTTGITARKLNRNYINIELHPDNVQLNQDRIERKLGMFP